MTTVQLSRDGIFYTLQGEGPLAGVPSVFVRLNVCNLRCKWGETICDAWYTSWDPTGSRITDETLLHRLQEAMAQHQTRHVVITGGEPTLQPEAVRGISHAGWHTTLETNGTHYVEEHNLDLICLSPKLKSSTPFGTKQERQHARTRWNPEVILQWMRHDYYFKIVIDTAQDIVEACAMLEEVGQPLEPERVLFMPQGTDSSSLWERGRWLAGECKRLGVRFCPRIQIDLYGNVPGT